jgi:hypothetical protein
MRLVAERISNTFADKYVTSDMAWGTDQEAAGKERFESVTGLIITDVGFIDHGRIPFLGLLARRVCLGWVSYRNQMPQD